MLISGVYVAGSEQYFPPVMTVIFVISAVISIRGIIRYNRLNQ